MAKTIRSSGHLALCEALIAARCAAGLTQAALASELGCHQSFVARVESGQRRIDVIELIVLARALNVDAEQILCAAADAVATNHRI